MKIRLNENFKKVEQNYLFSEIACRMEQYKVHNPDKNVISLGIGDVSLPIAPTVAREMSRAAEKLSTKEGFVGYGDTLGLKELRQTISERYKSRQIDVGADEIFISDGAKSDIGNLCDVLGDNEVLILDPVYPVYLESNLMSGRKIRVLNARQENEFLPLPNNLPSKPFVIYLCSPNNPTGAVFPYEILKKWVDFALYSGSLIVFDAAYEAYICEKSIPRSIFEIEGAKECAVEVCSFSKFAGFTGIRCGWTVIPRDNEIYSLWKRRQNTKFNGASYISQVGALAALSEKGEAENKQNVAYYMKNAQKIASFLKRKQLYFVGGENAPYLWIKIPFKMSSWEFFDYLLKECAVVCTPGVGFGKNGEEYFRFSSFASAQSVDEALRRMERIF